jgi:phage terminase small subunit
MTAMAASDITSSCPPPVSAARSIMRALSPSAGFGVKPNPAGPLYRGLVALQASLMAEFGLTPSSRVRLGGKEEKHSDNDPLAEFVA